jgi:hypothetical protein
MDLIKKHIHNVLWQASLSNGETFYEEKGNYKEIAGEPSPWQRLLHYTAQKRVLITSLALYTRDGRTFNLPSAGKNPRFAEFAILETPFDFRCERKIAREHDIANNEVTKSTTTDWFTVAVAMYQGYELQLWVDEMNTKNSWSLVVKI